MGTIDPYRFCKKFIFTTVICLLLFNEIYAREACKRGCPSADSGKFKYQPGVVYQYNFDSVITILVSGAESDETSLKVLGHANVYAEGNCAYTLQLDKVVVSTTKEAVRKEFTENINKPVQFTLTNGVLEPQICADESDSDYSLNIKRAVISLLQSSTKNYETDVFGVCPISSTSTVVGGAEIVTTTRNLNLCGHRETVSNGLVSGVINENAGIKSSSLLTGDYSKQQKVINGVVESVELHEEYQLVPVSTGNAGAKAKVKTNLKLAKQGGGAAPRFNGQSESIIFKHPKQVTGKNLEALKKAFETTISQVDSYAKSDAAQYFTELIRLMRLADSDTLTELSGVPHHNKNLARKVYLDALFRTGTSEAVKAIARQVPKMNDKEKTLAFLSFNLVDSVTKEALVSAADLLNANVPKEAYLAVGNLVGTYCRQVACDDNEIGAISRKFVEGLGNCNANSRAQEDRVVYTLKGIRNTYKLADAAVGTLVQCASGGHSARVRVAALQAFAAAGCNPNVQQKALSILKDRNEDSEVRIEAYLAAVSCPNAELATHIAAVVNSETVYQVGGFITTHLRGIRDSTDPAREAARYYLGNILVTKKFPIDPRRYSFNSELSYSLESLGVGASADYNLIYSQSGFLPRSGRLNLTSEVFGKRFNVMELSARQENLESVLEYYFGPKGFLNQKPQQLLDKLNVGRGRAKRSVNDDAKKFAKTYKPYGSQFNEDIDLDLSLKLFGSEFFFLSLGDNIPTNADELGRRIAEVVSVVKNGAKTFESNCQQHALFLDTELVYPTGVGFPLELVAQGTAVINIKLATQIDLEALFANPGNSKAKVKFVPSVNVNVNGQLRVDASLVSTGVRVATNLHSATGADVQLEIYNNGNAFNLDVELPRKNIELIELKHDVDFFVADRDKIKIQPLKHKKKAALPPGTFDQLQMFGVTVYYAATIPEFSASSAPLLLTGPVHFALKLDSETKISLKGVHEKTETLEYYELTYDTPGSQVPHTSSLKLELGSTPKNDPNIKVYARLAFANPQKKLAVEAGAVDNDQEFVVYGLYENDADTTTAKIGFTKHGQEYRPLLQTQSSRDRARNDIAGYKADGRVIVQPEGNGKRYQFENFRILQPKGEAIVANGVTKVTQSSSEVDLTVTSNGNNFRINAMGSIVPGSYALKGYLTNAATGVTHGGEVNVKLETGLVAVDLGLKAGEHSFDLHEHYEYSQNQDQATPNRVKFENGIVVKHKNNVMGSLKLNGEVKPNLVNYDFEAARQNKKVALYVNFLQNERNPGDYSLDVNAKLNKHYVDLKAKADVKGGKSYVDNVFTSSFGTQVTVKGHVGHRFSAQDVEVDLLGTVVLSPKDKQTSFLVKANGSPEKTTAEVKVNRENAELVSFNGEINRPGDKPITGKVNLSLKDTLVAKGDFKMAKNGRGELSFLVNLKKLAKKVKVDSKFLNAAPKYDLEVSVYFDPDKDKSRKVYYKTENVVDKQKFSTKNIFELESKKYTFDASGMHKGNDLVQDGETDYKFVLTLPTGRQFDGDLQRKFTTRNGVTNGIGKINLNDKIANNQKRSLYVEGILENYDASSKTFGYTEKVVYTNFDGKNLEVNLAAKHLPKGHFKMAEVTYSASGSILGDPADFHLKVDEYCKEHAIFRVSGKYGSRLDYKVNGNYYLGGEGKPYSAELQYDVSPASDPSRSFAGQYSAKFVRAKAPNDVNEVEIHRYEKYGQQENKFDFTAKGNANYGSYHCEITLPQFAPVKIDGNYRQEQKEKSSKYEYSVTYEYNQGQVVKTSVDLNIVDDDTVNFHYTLQTPHKDARTVDLVFKGKKSNDDTYYANSQLNFNGQNYGLNTVLNLSNRKTGVDITAITPERTAKLYGFVERFGERKAKAELKIENVFDLDFDGTAEASFQSYEDFYFRADLNSVKLKCNQVHIEAKSQEGSGGKGVTFLVKDASSNIISGNAAYNVKSGKGKAIVEGQGTIKYYDKTTNANFKLVRQMFDLNEDKEAGFSYTFNGTFGPNNVVSALKITTKNFHVKLASCEEKKPCTNFEIQSVVTQTDPKRPDHILHEAMVLIDLRALGYPHEFELQSKTTRSGFKAEHEIEASVISNNNNKYQFQANLKPTLNRIQVKLPKRDIVLETKQSVPERSLFGRYEQYVTFYFDKKNKPNEKTEISLLGDINGVENVAVNARGELKFEHPTVRPLSVQGQVELNRQKQLATTQVVFDVFRSPNQKVVILAKYHAVEQGQRGYNVTTDASLKSQGLGFDYEFVGHSALSLDRQELSAGGSFASPRADLRAGAYLFGSKDKFELQVNALNQELVNFQGNLQQRNKAKVSSKIQVLGSKPVVFGGEIEPTKVSFVLKQDNLFDVVAEVKANKEAKFTVTGSGKKLYNGRIALDPAHFLSTTYEVDHDGVQEFVKSIEDQVNKDTQRAREGIDKQFLKVRDVLGKQLEAVKNSAPDFSKFDASYQQHLNEIIKELEEDPVLNNFVGLYRRTYESVLHAFREILKTVSEFVTKLEKEGTQLYTKLSAALKDEVLPQFQEYVKKVTEEAGQFYVEAVKIVGQLLEGTLKALKSVEADLNKLGKPLSELLKPVAELTTELAKTLSKELEDFFKEIESYYQSLPTFKEVYAQVKEKLSEITLLDNLLPLLNEAVAQLQDYVTTEEGKEFLAKLHNYIDAKLRKAEVNDLEELEELYSSLLSALRSIITSLQGEGITSTFLTPLPYTFDAIKQLPTLANFKFSPLNFLRNEKFDTFIDLLTYRPPFSVLPPYELRGHVADGEHIFTFDGQHMTFPGSCSYVLAQDYVNNNFSVVANLNKGKLKSLALVDKSNYVEVNDQGQLKLNGKPTEFPVHKDDMHVWRRYYTISLLSEYGVSVLCSTDLRVCHVSVNGFYTGKLRGLLGNGNAEPYDDFTRPDGVVAENYATFGNAYGLANCPPVPYVDHSHHGKEEVCQELFDIDSTLLLGYLFIDPQNYREACNHAVSKAANKDDAACNIALAYASAARLDYVPVDVPSKCLKCNVNTPEQREIGAVFDTKVPQNKADVVFVVDTAVGTQVLSELITPVITDLRNQLKSRGIGDVHVAVIGYDQSQKYPQLYTTNGKLNFNGRLNEVNLEGPKYEEIEHVDLQHVDKLLQELRKSRSKTLTSSDAKAFNLALDYPFRAGASKVIVAVRSDNLEYNNVLKALGATVTNEVVKSKGISLHLIGPVKDLSVEGVPPEKIVGFNSRLVATVEGRDAKKRSKLQYVGDMGVDLVHSDGGFIFAIQNFEKQRSPDQKKAFYQAISSNIAEHTSKLEVVSECKCEIAYGLHAEDTCAAKSSQFATGKKQPSRG